VGNALTIIIKGREAGAIRTLNSVGLAIRRNREELIGLQEVQYSVGRASRYMLGAGLALGGGLVYLGKKAAEFQQELRNVNSMARLNDRDFKQLGADVLNIARNPVIADMPVDLAKGLYEVEGAGFKGRNALQVLETAAIGAAGGVEETAAAANSLVSILGAYGTRTGPDAVRTMDQLITMVEIGVLRFRDLTGEMGGPAAVAAQLKVPFEQVAAAIALMTTKGFSVAEAATAVERAMTSFLNPSKELTAAVQAAGYESATAALSAEGLAGAMALVEKAAGGDQAKLLDLFGGNVRALRAALSLTGQGAAEFATFVDKVKNSTGAAGRMAAEVARGPMFQFKKAIQELVTEATGISEETLLPIGTEFFTKVRDAIQAFRDLDPEQQKQIINWAIMGTKVLVTVAALGFVAEKLMAIIKLGAEAKGVLAGLQIAAGGGAPGGPAPVPVPGAPGARPVPLWKRAIGAVSMALPIASVMGEYEEYRRRRDEGTGVLGAAATTAAEWMTPGQAAYGGVRQAAGWFGADTSGWAPTWWEGLGFGPERTETGTERRRKARETQESMRAAQSAGPAYQPAGGESGKTMAEMQAELQALDKAGTAAAYGAGTMTREQALEAAAAAKKDASAARSDANAAYVPTGAPTYDVRGAMGSGGGGVQRSQGSDGRSVHLSFYADSLKDLKAVVNRVMDNELGLAPA
jgi:TP901 family phage tail tape measure protein